MVYGILRDKERLDAGEPTEITASLTRHEFEGLDALAAVLTDAPAERRKAERRYASGKRHDEGQGAKITMNQEVT